MKSNSCCSFFLQHQVEEKDNCSMICFFQDQVEEKDNCSMICFFQDQVMKIIVVVLFFYNIKLKKKIIVQ